MMYTTIARSAQGIYYVHPIGLLADDGFGNLIAIPEFQLFTWFVWDEDLMRYT